MTGIFIAYNQAYYMEIVELLEKNYSKGFTRWNEISGRGSVAANLIWEATHGRLSTMQYSLSLKTNSLITS